MRPNNILLLLAEACDEHRLTNTDLTHIRIESLDLDFSDKPGPNNILYVNQLDVPKNLSSKTKETVPKLEISLVETNTDLVPGVYEGGFKIWECSYDLLSYLQDINISGYLSATNVLDLGCGSGLPGILCALSGSNSVTFQDYNADVIKGVTIPNYWANLGNGKDLSCKPQFYSGPWDTFCNSIKKYEKSYDLILTSETIYNTSHYSSLINIFDYCLSLNGTVLLAAKVNYFGVGGGLRQFENALDAINKELPKWVYKTVKVQGEHVKREIIEIKRVL